MKVGARWPVTLRYSPADHVPFSVKRQGATVSSPASSELAGSDLTCCRNASARSVGTSAAARARAASSGARGGWRQAPSASASATTSRTWNALPERDQRTEHFIGDLLSLGNGRDEVTRNPAHH